MDKARYAVAIVKFDRADALAAHFALGRRGRDAASRADESCVSYCQAGHGRVAVNEPGQDRGYHDIVPKELRTQTRTGLQPKNVAIRQAECGCIGIVIGDVIPEAGSWLDPCSVRQKDFLLDVPDNSIIVQIS